MNAKKPYKTKVERDIQHSEDVRVSGLQGGKVLGDHLALFSLIMGIPFLLIGLYAIIGIIFDLGVPNNSAVLILSLVVLAIGVLFTIGGILLYRDKYASKK